MACTIDHLQSDHWVRVLRDFTDARGRSHHAGEAAILRKMGLDTREMEIWIEWEANGIRERLFFPLRATSGPGNGRMREYFELGDLDPGAVRPTVASSSPEIPSLPKPRGQKFSGRHPPAETNLGEVAVACDCDPALHRPVLIEFTGVNACLRCGTVTCTRSIGDDGRHTGDSWQAYIAIDVSPSVLDWLGQWPRVTVRHHLSHRWPLPEGFSRRDIIYLPANTRCDTATELIALEDQWLGQSQKVEFPHPKPPADLPAQLQAFGQFWAALQLTPQSDLSRWMAHADPRNPGSAIAVERFLRRADAFDVMVAALRSPDRVWQRAGVALARAAKPVDARLPGVLLEIMQGLSLAPRPDVPDRIVCCGRFEELLIVIADLKLATPEMFAALTRWQHRLVRHDADLVRAIGIVLRELRGQPAPERWGPFLP